MKRKTVSEFNESIKKCIESQPKHLDFNYQDEVKVSINGIDAGYVCGVRISDYGKLFVTDEDIFDYVTFDLKTTKGLKGDKESEEYRKRTIDRYTEYLCEELQEQYEEIESYDDMVELIKHVAHVLKYT